MEGDDILRRILEAEQAAAALEAEARRTGAERLRQARLSLEALRRETLARRQRELAAERELRIRAMEAGHAKLLDEAGLALAAAPRDEPACLALIMRLLREEPP